MKFLISFSPIGAVSFLSPGHGGRAADIQIARESGFTSSKYHYPGHQLLAGDQLICIGRGFCC